MSYLKKFLSIFLCSVTVTFMCSCTYKEQNINNSEVNNMSEYISINSISVSESKNMGPFFNEKKLHTKDSLLLQSAYLTLLNYYFVKQINLNLYQEQIDNNILNFPYDGNGFYYKYGRFGRKNICIRNNIFIDKLTEEQKSILKDAVKGEMVLVSDETLKLIDDTWKDVITIVTEKSEPHEIMYEYYGLNKQKAMTNALTFVIYYSHEYDAYGDEDDINESNKYQFLNELASTMEQEISKKLGCDVSVFICVRS